MQNDIRSLLQESAAQASLNGTANMTLEEITKEISIAREERHTRKESEREIFSFFPQYNDLNAKSSLA